MQGTTGNSGKMRRRIQSTAKSRQIVWMCPVEDCNAGPFRRDKLYSAGGHVERLAKQEDTDHEVAWQELKEGQTGSKRQRSQPGLTQHFTTKSMAHVPDACGD